MLHQGIIAVFKIKRRNMIHVHALIPMNLIKKDQIALLKQVNATKLHITVNQ